ncbi:hypothetical protein F4810DRAFT_142445 [Camillea tinctor]|nr:hypothetical protein F4810DRAFT_142445 [Camillea tinctor]
MSLPRLLPRRPTTTTPTTPFSPLPPSLPTPNRPFSTTLRRPADIIRRPRRPYTFTQLIQLSDGSTYTMRTTSPHALYKSTKDTRNNVLWQPREKHLRNVEVDEAGKLAAFRERFGTGWDADTASADGDTPAQEEEQVAGAGGRRGDGGERRLGARRTVRGPVRLERARSEEEVRRAEEEREAREKEKQEGEGNTLADLMAKYATPQAQIQSEKANVVRKKK